MIYNEEIEVRLGECKKDIKKGKLTRLAYVGNDDNYEILVKPLEDVNRYYPESERVIGFETDTEDLESIDCLKAIEGIIETCIECFNEYCDWEALYVDELDEMLPKFEEIKVMIREDYEKKIKDRLEEIKGNYVIWKETKDVDGYCCFNQRIDVSGRYRYEDVIKLILDNSDLNINFGYTLSEYASFDIEDVFYLYDKTGKIESGIYTGVNFPKSDFIYKGARGFEEYKELLIGAEPSLELEITDEKVMMDYDVLNDYGYDHCKNYKVKEIVVTKKHYNVIMIDGFPVVTPCFLEILISENGKEAYKLTDEYGQNMDISHWIDL